MTPHLLSPEIIAGLTENSITEIKVPGRTICLLRRQGVIHAFAASCPHAGAPICEGFVDARGSVVCPAHGYRFDPKNGYNRSGEGYKLRTYPVQSGDNGSVVILLPE